MKVVKLILDFILSMARIFLPRKGRRFCGKCGSLVGADGYCSYCDGTNGGGTGSSGSDSGMGETSEPTSGSNTGTAYSNSEAGETEPETLQEEFTNRLVGWAMITVATIHLLFA